jgi:hypothetical protein
MSKIMVGFCSVWWNGVLVTSFWMWFEWHRHRRFKKNVKWNL